MKARGKVVKLALLVGGFLLLMSLGGNLLPSYRVGDRVGGFPFVHQASAQEPLAESYHPYANNCQTMWTISEPGAAEMRIHFVKIELNKGSDYLLILDKDGRQLKSYTDYYNGVSLQDTWTEWYTGDTLKLKLTTDTSGTAFGFIADVKETR